MKSFKVKLEGPVGCGKDTFMDLVVSRLKNEYTIIKNSIYNAHELNVGHEWKVELKEDLYTIISRSTGVPRSAVKAVIHALTSYKI